MRDRLLRRKKENESHLKLGKMYEISYISLHEKWTIRTIRNRGDIMDLQVLTQGVKELEKTFERVRRFL